MIDGILSSVGTRLHVIMTRSSTTPTFASRPHNKYVYRPSTGNCVILNEFALSPVPALSNTDSLTKTRHDACATAMVKILVDSGHSDVLDLPQNQERVHVRSPHATYSPRPAATPTRHHPAQAFTNDPTSPPHPRTTQ
jgi:hypothetical protein